MKKLELKQIIKEEFNKLLKESTKIDKQGNIIYSLYDDDAEWDFSDSDVFMITWVFDEEDARSRRIHKKFGWGSDDFSIEIPIKDIINFYKDPTKSIENFKVPGGYIPITKQQASNILEDYYENWPEEINFELN